MTVIAAITDTRTVWLGADREVTVSGEKYDTGERKPILRVAGDGQPFVAATCGDVRLSALMRRAVQVDTTPDPADGEDCDTWAQAVADALSECAAEASLPPTSDGNLCGAAILGYAGRLWRITSHFAAPVVGSYVTFGSGGLAAAGAMHALSGGYETSHERVLRAGIRAATEHAEGCSGDPVVLKLTFPTERSSRVAPSRRRPLWPWQW